MKLIHSDMLDYGCFGIMGWHCSWTRVKFSMKTYHAFLAKLSQAQSRYSTFSYELLVIYLDIKHFRHLLEGWSFTIFTDHEPLTSIMNNNSDQIYFLWDQTLGLHLSVHYWSLLCKRETQCRHRYTYTDWILCPGHGYSELVFDSRWTKIWHYSKQRTARHFPKPSVPTSFQQQNIIPWHQIKFS